MKSVALKMFTLVAWALIGIISAQPSFAQSGRNVAQYNLQRGVGLKGFDPVAVFPEGGGAAKVGQPGFRSDYRGITYFFANALNQSAFEQNPEKYEPTYGGWCAYAMGREAGKPSKVDIQPQLFSIHGNRAHYFVANRAKTAFDQDVNGYESRADANWKLLTGEDPRF